MAEIFFDHDHVEEVWNNVPEFPYIPPDPEEHVHDGVDERSEAPFPSSEDWDQISSQ